jgi:tetratricopeptide (TPR) repeat protein
LRLCGFREAASDARKFGMSIKRLLAVVLVLLLPGVSVACFWDYDTLAMERARFPSALELITGKFLRHSPEFYEWRVRDRSAKVEKDPSNLALLDDLAVAYEKLGQHDKAIEIALKQDRIQPNRYETMANLGTFYIHAGQLDKGVDYIDKAIQINPDAHFGREKYQKLLVEYVLAQRKKRNGAQLPLRGGASFRSFLVKDGNEFPLDEAQAATRGVLGMMKFGNYDSPILLEALADVLTHGHYATPITPDNLDGKLLAARAYLKAAYEVNDPKVTAKYREFAKVTLIEQTARPDIEEPISLEALEMEFQKELAEARDWYAELREKEIGWIRDGKNPEEEFDKLYAQEPLVRGDIGPDTAQADQARRAQKERMVMRAVLGVPAIVLIAAFAAAIFIAYRVVRTLRAMYKPNLTSSDSPQQPPSA